MPRQNFIAIAGPVGVGKTTLAEALARFFQANLVLEEYDQNPFLSRQLAGDKGVALPSELFFLLSRAKQLNPDKTGDASVLIADYIFAKNRIFANMFLDGRQMQIFEEIETLIVPHIRKPDLVIYLEDTAENCLRRISARGRIYETRISAAWLEQLIQAYDDLVAGWQECPVWRFNRGERDLFDQGDLQYIIEQIELYLGEL